MTGTDLNKLWTPTLDWNDSSLLREALDDRFFRFWDYERDGEYPGHRDTKEEVDSLARDILDRNGESKVLIVVGADHHFMRGHPYRGGVPVETLTPTLAAMRILEATLLKKISKLDESSLSPPDAEARVFRQAPGLYAQLTPKDRLLPLVRESIDTERRSDDRLFLYKDWALFPHRGVREQRELIGDLARLTLDGGDVKLAIDPHRLFSKADRPAIGLKDYWFGIKVSLQSLDDPHVHGRTTYARRAGTHLLHAFPLLALNVDVSVDESLKTFSVEEVVPDSPQGFGTGRYVVNRYLHAIRDMDQEAWVHVDGAVKAYARETYEATIELPTGPTGPTLHYRKMWRVDGLISDEAWGRLLGHHFRNNELVAECFGDLI